ncbi:MFS transporter [Actinospica sp.]|jgi:MFS family permease|uniref:MFS transporter n=1 Tax=Actinospica sp. TaxID=1872142 RepID=UPI002BC8824C|nr:MFS transporter [Actinospica sp.]HWG27838.1 MFS transporter [Actinospica sp.]
METQVQSGFRRYFLGYATSLLGTAMAGPATVFAFLDTGRGADGLGFVLAAGILPILLCLPVAGVVADRFGCRRVILFADGMRCLNRAAFACALLLVHRPPTWMFVFFICLQNSGDGLFSPAYSALIPRLVGGDALVSANAQMSVARSMASVIGPSLSGALVAAFGPALVLGLDSASYAVSFVALLGIPVSLPADTSASRGFRRDLREGWSVFSSHPWYWMQTLQFALFNFLVWAPFLVLGPTLSAQRYGGARAWGVALGCNGLGAVIGGSVLIRGRTFRRPLLVSIIATAAYALAPGAFALRLPIAAIAVLMVLCGIGTSISGTLAASVAQRVMPKDALARVSAYNVLGAYAIGPIGLAIAAPIGGVVGYPTVLAFGATYQLASVALLLAIPAARRVETTTRTEVPSSASSSGPGPTPATAEASPGS